MNTDETLAHLEKYSDLAIELAIGYLPKLLLALVTLFIGFRIIKMLVKALRATLERKSVDASLIGFLSSLCEMALKVMLCISAAGMIGIEMTSFVAILASAGLAVGMALSGTLQNFAGGVLILILKPYKVGDFIEAAGFAGSVKEIQIFSTILTSPDNKRIIIPNASISNGSLVNYSSEPTRRIEWVFGIGYSDDVDKAKEILHALLAADSRVLQDPEPYVGLSALADSSVNFTVRAWVESADFLVVSHEMNEVVKKRFDSEGLSIPFPQTDVYLHKVAND